MYFPGWVNESYTGPVRSKSMVLILIISDTYFILKSILYFYEMDFKEYLAQSGEFSPESIAEIDSVFDRQSYPKGHKLVSPDNHSKKVFFFEKGLGRLYYFKEGKDITHHFFAENSFSASIDSIFNSKSSPFGLELLEPSVIRIQTYPKLERFVNNSVSAEHFINILLIDALTTFSDKLHAIQFQSAPERYRIMLSKYPDIFSRAPLRHIASYLGITQETLSRIRAGKL